MEITRNFAAERPGAVLALRRIYGIPEDCKLIAGDGYVRFWGPKIGLAQSRPFFLKDIRDAVRVYYGPYSCDCPAGGSWDQIH